MDKMRPIRIFWQDGVSIKQIVLAIRAIDRVLKLAGMDKKIKVEPGGKKYNPIVHRDEDVKSIFFGHYGVDGILKDFSFQQEKLDDCDKYYTIFLMKDKIFIKTNDGSKLVAGAAIKKEAAVICVGYYIYFIKSEMFWAYSVVMHELGHVFGLPSKERKEEIELSPINQGRHCANDCIMHYDAILKEPMNKRIFCSTCLNELRYYFKIIIITNFGTISP